MNDNEIEEEVKSPKKTNELAFPAPMLTESKTSFGRISAETRPSARSHMPGRSSNLRMSFDPSKVPATKTENPNIDKSKQVIDANIALQKAQN